MKQFLSMIILLFVLLIFHDEVITGTQNGLLLWYQILIPSLLPFILVTNALAETNAYQAAARHFCKYCPNQIYEIIVIFLGNLCGYPIGGKILNDFVINHYISPQKANKILSLASQVSPMFLMGYVHKHILKDSIPLSVFLLSIYIPVIVAYPFFVKREHETMTDTPSFQKKFSITDTFLNATKIMVTIGMYVIIFSIILMILLPFCKHTHVLIGLSFLEITTGLKVMLSLPIDISFKIPLLCALSTFGGLCSSFQIRGVLAYSGASIKKYLLDKIFLSAGTFLIIWLYLRLFPIHG